MGLLTLSQLRIGRSRSCFPVFLRSEGSVLTMRPRRLLMPARFLVGKFIDRDAQSAATVGWLSPVRRAGPGVNIASSISSRANGD